ncbi:MAG TPA: hypothetical protein VE982_04665 [Gaiellaceae bacterium]|nr:hypothetical protein [Gaiellaceae bacterium]
MAADPDLPDLDALAIELVELRRRRAELSRRHDRLQDRLAIFPNEFQRAQERAMADDLAALTTRIDQLEAQLLPLTVRRP